MTNRQTIDTERDKIMKKIPKNQYAQLIFEKIEASMPFDNPNVSDDKFASLLVKAFDGDHLQAVLELSKSCLSEESLARVNLSIAYDTKSFENSSHVYSWLLREIRENPTTTFIIEVLTKETY